MMMKRTFFDAVLVRQKRIIEPAPVFAVKNRTILLAVSFTERCFDSKRFLHATVFLSLSRILQLQTFFSCLNKGGVYTCASQHRRSIRVAFSDMICYTEHETRNNISSERIKGN